MIEIGQKVIFDPLQYGTCYVPDTAPEYVVGIITEVHKDHRWFLVEYPQYGMPGNETIRMGFKFDDLMAKGKYCTAVVIPISNRRDELILRHFIDHGDLSHSLYKKRLRIKQF